MGDNKIGVDPCMVERAIHLFRYQGKYCISNSHTLTVSFEPQTANRLQTFVQNDNSVMNCLNLPAALKPPAQQQLILAPLAFSSQYAV